MTLLKSRKKAGVLQKLSRGYCYWLGAAIIIAFRGAFAQTGILRAQLGNVRAATGVQKPGPVYVVLWFDTENYVLPQSDDFAKRIAEFLTAQRVQATFKVVGEKASTLERRHRDDVIAALNQHAIVYHSNFLSRRLSPAEFEQFLDWNEGVKEFIHREQPGIDSIRWIFSRMPTAYGQAGYSWCPESQPEQLETAQRPEANAPLGNGINQGRTFSQYAWSSNLKSTCKTLTETSHQGFLDWHSW